MTMAINRIKKTSMKKILKKSGLILGMTAVLLFTACQEKIDPVVEELVFDRVFTPIELTATISNVTTLTLKWVTVKNADHYVVEVVEGTDFDAGEMVYTDEVESSLEEEITVTLVLPAGDTEFSARVKAVSAQTGVDESKWITAAFRSGPENLFTGYESIMTGIGECTVNWKPASTATALLFVDGVSEITYNLTAGEIASGTKVLTGVPNGDYEIRLMNGAFVRGRVNLLLEGDIFLAAGGDITAALDALTAGQVLILANGADFGMTEVDTVTASIKIRGLYPEDLPTIYLMTGGGNHMFDIDPSLTLTDSFIFENVDISCYYDDAGVTRHRGIIDQELTALHLGVMRFTNCIIRNSGRSAVRLRGHANGQVIGNLEFIDCVLYDFAWDSHFGVVNPNAATASIPNIKFINTTAYNLRGGLINYGTGIGCQSIVIDNCTFDRTSMDAVSGRYFVDMGSAAPATPHAGPLTISDCLFGQTAGVANGVRANGMTLAITGSFYTTDFYDGTAGPIKSYMQAYSGASTSLWTNPSGGDYTFADTGFAGIPTAGDPRWRP